jgi:hypothetical protein
VLVVVFIIIYFVFGLVSCVPTSLFILAAAAAAATFSFLVVQILIILIVDFVLFVLVVCRHKFTIVTVAAYTATAASISSSRLCCRRRCHRPVSRQASNPRPPGYEVRVRAVEIQREEAGGAQVRKPNRFRDLRKFRRTSVVRR